MAHQQHYCLFDTAIGLCGVAWSELGLTRVQLPEADRAATERRLQARCGTTGADAPPPTVAQAISNLQRYFSGADVDFSAVVVDFTDVGAFNRGIYDATRRIAWGCTVSYGELARLGGAAGLARAVGQTMAQNPVPIIVPCHRVLAKGGGLGGFSAYGGAVTKERLLALEGVSMDGDAPLLPGIVT